MTKPLTDFYSVFLIKKTLKKTGNRWKFLHTLIQIHLIPTASTLLTGEVPITGITNQEQGKDTHGLYH